MVRKLLHLFMLFYVIVSVFSQTWTRTFGIEHYDFSECFMVQTIDNRFVVGGWGLPDSTVDDRKPIFRFISLDLDGDVVWDRVYHYGDLDSMPSILHSGYALDDGGFVFAGEWSCLWKFDSTGETEWYRVYPDSTSGPISGLTAVVPALDGGYIATGYDFCDVPIYHGLADMYVVKTDSYGNIIWRKFYDFGYVDEGWSICIAHNNGYLIGGNFGDGGCGSVRHSFVINIDDTGGVVWRRIYGTHYESSWIYRIIPLRDGGYVFVGGAVVDSTDPGSADMWLARIDEDGTIIWERRFSYNDSSLDNAADVKQTDDLGFIIVGYTSWSDDEEIYLLKTDSEGNLEWQKTFGGPEFDIGYSVEQAPDGGYIMAGLRSEPVTGLKEYYIIKTDSLGEISWVNDISSKPPGIVVYTYPTPFNSNLNISLSLDEPAVVSVDVYDVSGKLVRHIYSSELGAGSHRFKWDGKSESGKDVSSGVYLIRATVDNYIVERRVILVR